MTIKHATDFDNLRDAIIGFVHFVRAQGLNIGIRETQEALLAADYGLIESKSGFCYALKSIFCSSEEEGEQFEKWFNQYWDEYFPKVKGKRTIKNRSNIQKKSSGSLVWMGTGEGTEESEEEGKNVSGANKIERLRRTDFSKVSMVDSELLEQLAMQLWKQMSLRIKRKMKTATNQGRIDLRKTIRANISNGGDPIQLKRKKRLPSKQRLIILLDVSGSMDKYSFFLLRFIWALRSHFEQIEAFIFSTDLVRITEFLDQKDLENTLKILTASVHNWSSGTQIGGCLKTFNDQYAKRVLSGKSTTIVLSDGLDTGEPGLLTTELNKIKRRTRRLIWLNPLKGMQGYEPTAKGMSAALPELDVFQSAHNLDSLLELEKYLSYV